MSRVALAAGLLLWSGVTSSGVTSSVARAHGPAPAVLEVLAADADGRPTLLRTSVGLAEARDDGTYGYLCPSLWSGNELARAFALDDGRVAVIDAGTLHVSDRTREVFSRDEALERAFAVRDVAADADRFFVLARERTIDGLGRSALFVLGAPPTFLDEMPDDLLAREGAPWATAPSPSLCDADACARLDAAPVDRLVLRAIDADAFWLLATTDARELWRVDRATLAVEPGPRGELVLGPVALEGIPTAIVDGVVHRYVRGAWVASDEQVAWSSFESVDGHVFVASLEGAFVVTDSLATPRLVFRFTQLGLPRGTHEDMCARDWAHFGGEAGWVGTEPATSPDGDRQLAGSAGGCDVTSSRGGASSSRGGWLALVLFGGLRRRSTSPPKKSHDRTS